MKYAYFQGCSLESTAIEYHLSTVEICRVLGIELIEFEWCCCGASSAHMTDELAAFALPALNLARAEKLGLDMIIPCAACYNRQAVANDRLRKDPAFRERILEISEEPYNGGVGTFALIDVLANKLPRKTIEDKVSRRLEGLKVVSYYGCQFVRPPGICDFDDREDPQSIDNLARLTGAEVLDWGYKVFCCGASLALSRTDIAEKRCERIARAARGAGADCLVAACPLCQANLDQRAGEYALPVLYITELLGLSFGIDYRKLGLQKHIVDTKPLLRKSGLS